MKRNRRYNKWGYAYAKGFVVLAEGLDMFRLGMTIGAKHAHIYTCCLVGECAAIGWDMYSVGQSRLLL
jgi:hypothetical protein